jgi:hypothetical protein
MLTRCRSGLTEMVAARGSYRRGRARSAGLPHFAVAQLLRLQTCDLVVVVNRGDIHRCGQILSCSRNLDAGEGVKGDDEASVPLTSLYSAVKLLVAERNGGDRSEVQTA